jgi:hypothetical protein
MIQSLVRRLIAEPDAKTLDELFDDKESVFWVDHRESDDAIAEYCEELICTGKLSANWLDDELFLSYGDKRTRVPLTQSPADRHITLVALNEILAPDFDVRLAWDSTGGDTLAFAVLSQLEWRELEEEFGIKKVSAAFLRLTPHPNVFTEPLRRPSTKPWWRFS